MVHDEGPLESTVEEAVEKHESPPSAAKGLRLALSGAMVLIGIALIAVGLFVVSADAVRVVSIVCGVVLAGAFAHVANGATKIDVQGSQEGAGVTAQYPEDKTIRTRKTTVRTKGLPKHGVMPPKQGEMPRKATRQQRRRRGGGSD